VTAEQVGTPLSGAMPARATAAKPDHPVIV
jgi:hypothetical protein